MPNAVRTIYGDSATAVYGIIFSFTGTANLLILFLVPTDLGQEYGTVFKLSGVLCLIALFMLIFCLKEERLSRPLEQTEKEEEAEQITTFNQGYIAVKA